METNVKIRTYEMYLQQQNALPFEQMCTLHTQMVEEVGDDPDAVDLYGGLLDAAEKYMEIRAKWAIMSREEKQKIDESRTNRHDAVIRNLDILARYLRSIGKDAAWRDALGDPAANTYNRKAIGDFGCYLAFVSGINMR